MRLPALFSMSVAFMVSLSIVSCTSPSSSPPPPPSPPEEEKELIQDSDNKDDYVWVAVSAHGGWETSKRVDTFRPETPDAWRASYRIGQLGYYNFTCRTLPTVEGVSGISTTMRYFLPHILVARNEWMLIDILVDGNTVASDTYISTDPDGERRSVAPESDIVDRIFRAFTGGSEAELRTSYGEGLGLTDSTRIPLTGFREAAVWVRATCMEAAN